MTSSESGSAEPTGRADSESLADNASAKRALEDLRASGASPEGRPQPPIDLTAAAFFDVDNTLVQGSSAVHFGRGLAARNYFTYRDVLGFVYAQAKFQLLGTENSADVAAGRRKALAGAGVTARSVVGGLQRLDEMIDSCLGEARGHLP